MKEEFLLDRRDLLLQGGKGLAALGLAALIGKFPANLIALAGTRATRFGFAPHLVAFEPDLGQRFSSVVTHSNAECH